jgi:DNA-binding CsgD family transcriptional regulator
MIATQLGIKVQTVKNHVSEINRRIGTNTREQILIKCLKEGEIELEEIFYS